MASGLTLDAGALVAAEKRDRRFWAFWHEAIEREAVVTIPAPVLAQVWRGNSAIVSKLLKASVVEPMDVVLAKGAGQLLAAVSGMKDVVDAAVVFGASRRGDAVLTSDPKDIARLAAATRRQVKVIAL